MMPIPEGAPLTVRLGARLGPEIVASILVLAVVLLAATVALSGTRGSTAGPSPAPSLLAVVPSASATPSASVAPSASPAASATAVPSATASPSATPVATATPTATEPPVASTPTPPATPTPAQAAAAQAVLNIVDQLLGQRADLIAEIEKPGTDSRAIADLLRDINTSIVRQDAPLADLESDPATADLASRIRAVNTAVAETIRRIQHTSPRNAKTYRDGAMEVIQKLEPLPALRAELAALAG
jgi:hypothetical protein